MSPFYTKTGDDGSTGLLGEGRVPKHSPRLEAIGSIDEANAAIGMARANCKAEPTGEILLAIQNDLYYIMAEIAATRENVEKFRNLDASRVTWLEEKVEQLEAVVQIPDEFIVPGDTPNGAFLSNARTTTRRAERRVAKLVQDGEIDNAELLRYLNRASSLIFVLELLENSVARDAPITLVKPKP